MQIDLARAVGAVTREVTQRNYDGKPANVIAMSRTYDTTVADAWDALTNAERIPRWFLPISGDLRPGGRFQLKGNAGGEILACKPPEHLKVTWEFGGQMSWVEVRVAPEGAGARLTLEHIAHAGDASWEKYGPGAGGVGWDMAFVGLALHMETGAAVDPKEAEKWFGSDEGKTFIRASSEGWYKASVAGGTEAAAARAAADRTTAAYTGETGAGA